MTTMFFIIGKRLAEDLDESHVMDI
jgi:hypothetical protein